MTDSGAHKYIAAAFQAVFGAIGCIAEPFMDIADYMRNERMDSDHMGSEVWSVTVQMQLPERGM